MIPDVIETVQSALGVDDYEGIVCDQKFICFYQKFICFYQILLVFSTSFFSKIIPNIVLKFYISQGPG